MPGHEIRDHLFARLFGFVSVIQSGLLFRNFTLPTSGSSRTVSSTLSDFKAVTAELLALGEKKSWIMETCWWALDLSVTMLSSSVVPWKDEAISWLSKTIYGEQPVWTSEKVALTIKLQGLAPSLSWKQVLAPTFKDGNLLSSKNVPIVARILRVSTAVHILRDSFLKDLSGIKHCRRECRLQKRSEPLEATAALRMDNNIQNIFPCRRTTSFQYFDIPGVLSGCC